MKTYIYVLKLKKHLYRLDQWLESDMKLIDLHFERIKTDFESEKIIHVGRTVKTNEEGFGLVIFHAKNLIDAKAYAKSDPAVLGGIMTVTCKAYKVIF